MVRLFTQVQLYSQRMALLAVFLFPLGLLTSTRSTCSRLSSRRSCQTPVQRALHSATVLLRADLSDWCRQHPPSQSSPTVFQCGPRSSCRSAGYRV